jgi:hypothetical protein
VGYVGCCAVYGTEIQGGIMKIVDDDGNEIGVVIGDVGYMHGLTEEDFKKLRELITEEIDNQILEKLGLTANRLSNPKNSQEENNNDVG